MTRDLAVDVEATFTQRGPAERAADDLRRSGIDAMITIDAEADRVSAVRGEMAEEADRLAVAPSVGPITRGMARGVAVGVPIGAGFGAAFGLLVAWLPLGWPFGMSSRLIVGVLIGAAAGSIAGFVAGGLTGPVVVHEGEPTTVEQGVVLGVHAGDVRTADRAEQIVRRYGAERVERLEHGYPQRG